ncbi:unnamed protein product [Allacma fusca]|uniref:MULE transposase domain-containing protein n=1 Tax=Allacma fusca TaxID=39272 RepID=A0A8J2KSD1_9HEXA|nr:unnamed protein product [Allacma fusca]
MEVVKVNWISGNRKNNLAEVDNFLFEKNKVINGGTSYRCLQYRACPAKLHVMDDGSTVFGQHNHPPDPDRIAARKIIATAKENALASWCSNMASIMQSVEDEATRVNLDVSYLGRTNSLKRRINDAKVRQFGLQSLGESFATLQIPEPLEKTMRNQRFLLYDNNNATNRVIIFASDDSLDKLSYCDTWLLDGTFKTCPTVFQQLYTVHGIYKHSVAVPFVYMYLPGKSAEIYKEAFQVIRQKTPNEPSCIISDFESAAIIACQEVFIATELSGCLFHLTQSIFRRVQQDSTVFRRYMASDEDGKRLLPE